jgi:hypothetical protein
MRESCCAAAAHADKRFALHAAAGHVGCKSMHRQNDYVYGTCWGERESKHNEYMSTELNGWVMW